MIDTSGAGQQEGDRWRESSMTPDQKDKGAREYGLAVHVCVYVCCEKTKIDRDEPVGRKGGKSALLTEPCWMRLPTH